ncbi:hypothetical protein RhiirC2_775322 [Rhizophagus irregularis]|uniref:Cytochrome P450 n=1 Tax=Rhizophagus irregularis TaxID=588596 RepID=A0A2N1NJD3_9GLOM|nr:hypothetical protein RhiirC2_775322 [Rhizophagus irregularis]
MRFNNSIKPEEFGTKGKGILFNNNFKSWVFNRQFFSQAILSLKFTDEAIDWINKLFDELESYWNKLFLEEIIKENKVQLDFSGWFNNFTNDIIISLLTGEKSYSMAAYFTTLSDEKSQSAMINDSVKLAQALPNDILNNMGFLNQRLDAIIKRPNRSMTDSEIRVNLLEGIITGTHKSANMFLFIVYYIAHNPEVKKQENVRRN